MKYHELQAVAKRLGAFTFISRARRVEDNTLELVFDKSQSYFFSMTRGHSLIYKAPSQRPMQGYNAPFDKLLHSLLSASRIVSVGVLAEDRVLQIVVAPKSSYKDKLVTLQLEFTGRNTNAILLDEGSVVIEALRHIDAQSSFRVVRPAVELLPLPPYTRLRESQEEIADIDGYLEAIYQTKESKRLHEMRGQKQALIRKKIKKFDQLLCSLPDEAKLLSQAQTHTQHANLLLSNLYAIKPYDSRLKTYDYEGKPITIALPKETKVTRMPDYYFNLAKRAKSKAKRVHIEQENLESKKAFYENIYQALGEATTPYALALLVPKRAKSLRKKEKLREGELFWIEDYKVMVGRNSSENQKLLGLAKSNDIWMHIRDLPSSHVIIKTDKQNLPNSVIEAAAKLCVDFSVKNAGEYEVDYTKRKFVKIQEGSSVLYTKYDTIRVTKEGVEIRV